MEVLAARGWVSLCTMRAQFVLSILFSCYQITTMFWRVMIISIWFDCYHQNGFKEKQFFDICSFPGLMQLSNAREKSQMPSCWWRRKWRSLRVKNQNRVTTNQRNFTDPGSLQITSFRVESERKRGKYLDLKVKRRSVFLFTIILSYLFVLGTCDMCVMLQTAKEQEATCRSWLVEELYKMLSRRFIWAPSCSWTFHNARTTLAFSKKTSLHCYVVALTIY